MLYSTYIDNLKQYNLSYRYKMIWQKQNGYEILAKENLKTGKREYLGRRSSETTKLFEQFHTSKKQFKERLAHLKEKLKKEQKLNKLERITRAPKELVKILKKINELALDEKLIVIGTNSLYAYEARAGVMIEQEHLATYDIDLLNRREKGFSLLFNESPLEKKAIELLQSIDVSFQKNEKVPYRFENRDGIWVELINPISADIKQESFKNNIFKDVISLSMKGMHWLENSRLFKEMIIGSDGSMAFLTTIHPLEYAIYKNWLSKREDRDYQKHFRDLQQSKLVTEIIRRYMININIKEELSKIQHFKKELIKDYNKDILLQ